MPASKLMKWLPKCLRAASRTPAGTALALQALEAREVPATMFDWTGNAGNNWGDDGNWAGGQAPTAAVTDAVYTFPAGSFSINNVAGLTADKITIGGGTTILLGAGVSLGLDGVPGDQIVATGANSAIAGGAGLNLIGTAQVNVAAGTQLDFNTPLTGSTLRKVGAGTLKLTGAASYTGDTQAFDGVLALGNTGAGDPIGTGDLVIGNNNGVLGEVRLLVSNQLPAATSILIRSDGELDMNGFDDVIGDVTLAGGDLLPKDGNLAIAGIHATADATITAAAGGRINLLSGEHVIEVDDGKVLTLGAPIHNAGASVGAITKTGLGELRYANPFAADPNTYTGQTWVKEGTLSLQDQAGDGAFGGDLKVGDGTGAAATVRLDLGNEIPNTATVTVLNDGTFELGTHDDTIKSLTLLGGAKVTTTTGKLTLTGGIDLLPSAILPATITGNLVLTAAGVHNINLEDYLADADLIIDGVISGGGGFSLYGPGVMRLQGAGANTYTGDTVVFGGTLELAKPGILNATVSKKVTLFSQAPSLDALRLAGDGQIPNDARVSVSSGARFNLNGHLESIGELVLDSNTVVATGAAGSLILNDDVTFFSTGSGATITGNLDLGGAERTFEVFNAPFPAVDLRIDAVISNGSLKKTGDGTLALNGANTYAGATTVEAGTLLVNGSQPGSDVVPFGGTLGGTGAVGKVTGGIGTIAPGTSPGTLTTSDLTTSGVVRIELNGPAAGQSDQLKVNGTVDLTGAVLDLSLGFTPAVGQTFTIIDNNLADAVEDTFANLPDGGTVTVSGVTFSIDYNGGTGGNDVVLTVLSVPQPPQPPANPPEPYAVGAGQAGGNTVRVYNPDGTPKVDVPAFEGNVSGGVRTATADVTGDGVADLIVGTGPGTVAEVRVFDGATGQRVRTTLPFADFQGGVFVAAADFDNDGFDDVIITPDEGGGPRVSIYSGKDGSVLSNFFAIDDANFRGGARAAAGDVNGDGTPDLVVSAGFGGGPRIAVFDGTSLGGTPTKLMNDFFAFEQALRNGAYVAVGDLNADGKADLIFGGGPGGGPRVLALDPVKLMQGDMPGATLANFFAGNDANRGGVRVTAKNLDGDGMADLVVGDGAGAGSRVTAYLGKDMTGGTPPAQTSFDAYPGFLGGVFVG